jgi:hypothetical protein
VKREEKELLAVIGGMSIQTRAMADKDVKASSGMSLARLVGDPETQTTSTTIHDILRYIIRT